MTPRTDPILKDDDEEIDRIRAARHRISERFGHDPYRLVAYYMERQKVRPDRLLQPPKPKTGKSRQIDDGSVLGTHCAGNSQGGRPLVCRTDPGPRTPLWGVAGESPGRRQSARASRDEQPGDRSRRHVS